MATITLAAMATGRQKFFRDGGRLLLFGANGFLQACQAQFTGAVRRFTLNRASQRFQELGFPGQGGIVRHLLFESAALRLRQSAVGPQVQLFINVFHDDLMALASCFFSKFLAW